MVVFKEMKRIVISDRETLCIILLLMLALSHPVPLTMANQIS